MATAARRPARKRTTPEMSAGDEQRNMYVFVALAALGRIPTAGSSTGAFYGALTHQVAEIVGADACVLYIDESAELRPAGAAWGIDDNLLAALPVWPAESGAAAAIPVGVSLTADEAAGDPRLHLLFRAVAGEGGSVQGARLMGQSGPIGILVAGRRRQEYALTSGPLLEIAAAQASPLVESFLLYQEAETERRFLSDALSRIVDRVIVVDRGERLRYANPAADRALGGHVPVGTHSSEYLARVKAFDEEGNPISADRLPISRALREGETVRHEVGIRELPDGTRRYVDQSSAPLFDESGDIYAAVSVVRDISRLMASNQEREQLLIELEASEGRLRVVLDTMDDAVAVLHEGRVVLANQRFRELFGLERDVVGHSLDVSY